MNQTENIIKILLDSNRPMMKIDDIHKLLIINDSRLSYKLNIGQLYDLIDNYPSLFQNLNGYILLVNSPWWNNISTIYNYLRNLLLDTLESPDIQYFIATLFIYRRFTDVNNSNFFDITNVEPINIYYFLDVVFNNKTANTFDDFKGLQERLKYREINELYFYTNKLEVGHLSDIEFGKVFEYFILLSFNNNNRTIDYYTHFNSKHLLINLLGLSDDSTIYDPVAGYGSLILEMNNNHSKKIFTVGSEINRRICQLGNMNLLANGLSVMIHLEDSFNNLETTTTYDFVIGEFPHKVLFKQKKHHEYYGYFNDYFKCSINFSKNGNNLGNLILLAVEKLNSNGKAVILVPDSFLINGSKEKHIRKILIENDIIEAVISLPSGTLRPFSENKNSVLIINKNKAPKFKGLIQFITAKKINNSNKFSILDTDEIIQHYHEKKDDNKNSIILAVEELNQNISLLPASYDTQFWLSKRMLKDKKAILLGELVNIQSGITQNKLILSKNKDIPLIKIEKLNKDILDINLVLHDYEGVDFEAINKKNIVSDKCVLITRIGENLKATIFEPTSEIPEILLHTNIYSLIPNAKYELNIEYLYYQLYTTFIQEQISKRKVGAAMPSISKEALKEIVIPYMSLEAQNEFVLSQKANLIAEERKRVEERIKALNYKEETKQAEATVIKTLTHQLRPKLQGLNSLVNRIERIVNRENLSEFKESSIDEAEEDLEFSDSIIKPDNFTFKQLINKLNFESSYLSEIISNVDKIMNFKLLEEDFSKVDILSFIEEYVTQKRIENTYNYKISVKGEKVQVLIHQNSFKDLLDQLFENAEKHAFSEQNENKQIAFTVKFLKTRNIVSIEYSNNGKPYDLSKKDYITAFEKGYNSTGTGIGGNYIHRIIEAHNGDLIIEEYNKKGFSLTIELIKNE